MNKAVRIHVLPLYSNAIPPYYACVVSYDHEEQKDGAHTNMTSNLCALNNEKPVSETIVKVFI